MLRRPPRSTRLTHSFPTRRSSDLHDEGLNRAMLDAARDAKFDAVALTVDTIVGGNRERCLRSGFTSPPRFTPRNMLSYAIKPGWGLNYVLREKFSLPNLDRKSTRLNSSH